MIRITDQYFWNVIFGIFFLSLFVMAAVIIDSEGYITRETISLADIVLITLASFRVTQLFVYENMTKFIREQFLDAEVKRGGSVVLSKPKYGPRRTLGELMTSPWAFGVLATTITGFFYLLAPLAYFPTLILAIAGVASMLQILANLITNTAERLK